MRDVWRRQIDKRAAEKISASQSAGSKTRRAAHLAATFLITSFDEKIPCQKITSLVTAEAVKEVLRSEEVRSALKQKLRHNLEARLDAEVDAILDELLGVQAEPPTLKREIPPQRAGEVQPESPVADATEPQPESV